MARPACYICGRWDGSHSGGCPNVDFKYGAVAVPDAPVAHRREATECPRPATCPWHTTITTWYGAEVTVPRPCGRGFHRILDGAAVHCSAQTGHDGGCTAY